ncbi:MAG: hypothetical protein Q4F00_07915 [bacterium]|nr:hypothetical protein [bacterium]
MAENTYRTILFEEFDREKTSLDTILFTADSIEMAYQDVKEKLAVHSFEEFLEKFAPKVYEKYEPSADGSMAITYSTQSSPGAVPLDIVSNSYYKMLLNLYHSKEKSGASNLQFNYEELFEQLKPKHEYEAALNVRKQLQASYDKYYELQEKGESTDGVRAKFNRCFQKVREQYESSVVNLLPLAMADLDARITAADRLLAQNAGKSGDEKTKLASGYKAFFKEDGTLGTVPVKTEELPENKQLASGERKLLSAVIESDYDKRVNEQNSFVRALVVSTYSPLAKREAGSGAEVSLAEVREQQKINTETKQKYEKVFRSAKDAFIQCMTETVQKLLDMQILFDHATCKGELRDGLLIANCSVGQLLRECKDAFKSFITRVGHDTVGNRIWFAIVPGVAEAGGSDSSSDEEEDLLGGAGASDGASAAGGAQTARSVTMNELRQFLPIMDEARIMTVFSFRASDENGFMMTPKDVEDKRAELSDIKYKHAVYAYPNFTLTRSRMIELFEGVERLKIPGVYIDAAYVAGGLLMGSQQHAYLKQRGLPVHPQLPCVRIDFENTAVRQKLVTRFNREADFGFNEELRQAINEDRLGFVFSGDALGDIKNTYVYIANTLYKESGSAVYSPIYSVLLNDYVHAVYKQVPDKTRRGVEKEFIKGTVADWKRCAEPKDHCSDVNLLLYDGEKIVLEDNPETGKPELKIKLSKLELTLDDLEINVEQKS